MRLQKLLSIFFNIAIFSCTLADSEEAIKVTSADEQTILEIELNESVLIELDTVPNTVLIADPETADIYVSSEVPNQINVIAKKIGETRLQITDDSNKVIVDYRIAVIPDLSQIRQAIASLIDNEVTVKGIADGVALIGTVPSAKMAEDIRRIASHFISERRILNLLKVANSNQVNLRVRVLEVARDISRDIGINWDISAGRSPAPTIQLSSRTLSTARGSFSAAPSEASYFLQTGASILGSRVDVLVNFLDEEGLVTVISEPNLTTLSGEKATFLAGGEIPILVPDSDGRVTIEYKEFGVSLAFTPTIIDGDLINLHVIPEVSQLSNANSVTLNTFVVPSLTTRRAETTVELRSGQSFSIAGLLQNNLSHTYKKIPGLGDIPILGALFRSESFLRNETELVILVTPYIVQPFPESDVISPAEGLSEKRPLKQRQSLEPAGFLLH